MDTVGIKRDCQLNIIVHDEGDTMLAAYLLKLFGQVECCCSVQRPVAFFPELKQRNSAFNGLCQCVSW